MKAELLAPAGSYESLIAAVNAGADAVYIGGSRFGARAYAENPNQEMLVKGMRYCHLHGVKLYLTVNTLFKERELERDLYPYLAPLYEEGLDAVILQDMGALSYMRQQFPELELHASTQMTLTGPEGCAFLEQQGVSRVVLSRELSLEEIKKIRAGIQCEIEAFVHGALCYCYSGQCLFSSIVGGRSGNRGRCAQPCRLPYGLAGRREEFCQKTGPYLLSPKDICTLDILPDILEAGVFSLKIEGRMKRPEYTAGVVRVYRKYLDEYLKNGRDGYTVSEKDVRMLQDLYNRGGFSKGYFVQHNGKNMIYTERPNHNGTQAARIWKVAGSRISVKALEPLGKGDLLELPAQGQKKAVELRVQESVKKGDTFSFSVPGEKKPQKDQVLRRVRNEQLLNELKKSFLEQTRQEKINGNLKIFKGQPAILTVSLGDCTVKVQGETAVAAQSQPLKEETIRRQMEKTGSSPFAFEALDIQVEDGCFLTLKSLNELRRTGLEELERALSERRRPRVLQITGEIQEEPSQPRTMLRVSLEQPEGFDELLKIPEISGIYLDHLCFGTSLSPDTVLEYREKCRKANKQLYYVMPWIVRDSMMEWYRKEEHRCGVRLFDGILIKNVESFQYLKEIGYEKPVFLDHNMYTYNRRAVSFWRKQGISMDTAPLELNAGELAERGCHKSEVLVYGRIPMMVSAQCLHKTAGVCRQKEEIWYLKDRKGKLFPVRNHCLACYNVIYNCVPLKLEDCGSQIDRLRPASLRLSFTIERPGEMLEITKRYVDSLIKGGKVPACEGEFTRGHFKRGIE